MLRTKKKWKYLKKIQIERIMKAYQLIKEALELLKDIKEEFPIKRLKIDHLEAILFKNSGMPNQDALK